MRIALVTTGLGLGGAEVVVKELALQLRARHHQVAVISLRRAQFFVDDLQAAGVRVISGDLEGDWRDLFRTFRLVASLWEWNPDIVHSHLFHANILARALCAFRLSRCSICSIHNTYELGSRSECGADTISKRELLYRYTDQWCCATVQISEMGLARYRRLRIVRPSHSMIIYNGIDFRTVRTAEGIRDKHTDYPHRAEFRWLACGRFVEQKNFLLLIRTAALLKEQGRSFRLWLYGEGPLRVAYRREIVELGLEDVVHLAGVKTDFRTVIPTFDAFVLSSNYEGLPIVLIEAAASGLPIVTTDVGGSREVLDEYCGGRVVPPFDERQLAGAMAEIMDVGAAARTQMGQANRRRALGCFDLDGIVTRWEHLYRECARFN